MEITKKYLDDLSYAVIGAAIEVNKILGPGLLENVYHMCMKKELFLRGIKFQSEKIVLLEYKGLKLETALRCDMLIEGILPVEFKSVEYVLPVHKAQIFVSV